MNSLAILIILTTAAGLYTMRVLYLDAERQRRRADRLAARCNEMRTEIEDLHHIIWPTEPTQPWNNVRVLKDTDK
jgi:hypothetical protein